MFLILLKFPTTTEHVSEARQYPRSFLHLTEGSHPLEVGILTSADMEAETQASNPGGVKTRTQTCLSHNHSAANWISFVVRKQTNLRVNSSATQAGEG